MRYILATLALAAAAQARPDDSYGAPAAPSYSAPSPSYSAPSPSYSAPAPSYSAPAESYDAPAESYGAPAPAYGAPSYGSPAPAFDLKIIIIPIIALIGLFLLFPTYVTLTTVRRKRDVAETDLATDVVNRIQDMYMVRVFQIFKNNSFLHNTLHRYEHSVLQNVVFFLVNCKFYLIAL